MNKNKRVENSTMRVILNNSGERPHCDHGKLFKDTNFTVQFIMFSFVPGPMLLFERNSEHDKRFFACSAYRDRKLCSSYVLESSWLKPNKDRHQGTERESYILSKSKELTQVRLNVFNKIKTLNRKQRNFCQTCGFFILDTSGHLDHKITRDISDEFLQQPSLVFFLI